MDAHDTAIWIIRNPFVVLHLHNWPNSFCMKYINVWGIIAISISFLLYVLLLYLCYMFWINSSIKYLMKQNNPFANIATVKVLFCLIITYSCKCARVYTTIGWRNSEEQVFPYCTIHLLWITAVLLLLLITSLFPVIAMPLSPLNIYKSRVYDVKNNAEIIQHKERSTRWFSILDNAK